MKVPVHRLVLITFEGGPPFVGAECRHKNGNKRDNRYENLEWGTHAENMADMARHIKEGVLVRDNTNMCRGDNHPMRRNPGLARSGNRGSKKLRESDIPVIMQRITDGHTYRDIANDYNVSDQLIYRINKNKCWVSTKKAVG